jgi:transposase
MPFTLLKGIPVYMQAQSGNINDVEGFKKIVKSHISSLKAAQQCRYLEADAALYIKEAIVELGALSQLFITRVPQKPKEANTLIQIANFLIFAPIFKGYQGVWHTSHYGDVEQKWLLVRTEQTTKRRNDETRTPYAKFPDVEAGRAEVARPSKKFCDRHMPVALMSLSNGCKKIHAGSRSHRA